MTAGHAVHMLRRFLERLGDENAAHDQQYLLGAVTLFPHQASGARQLLDILAAHGGALLADEVGLGKTFTALQVARHFPSVLVVVPAALRPMWQRAADQGGVVADIVSYERLSAGRFDARQSCALVVLDEAHHARTPGTRRYRALESLTRGARVLLMTATPIHNRRRDLEALFALFLGAGAASLDRSAWSALIVRRRVADVSRPFPALAPLVRHTLPRADAVLEAVRALPPPLPPADGGVAQALVALQLTRAWCSSDAALLVAIRRRLVTAVALEQSLECGRLPARRDLASWTASPDGAVQLAFPLLVAAPARGGDVRAALEVVRAHAAALRDLRALVRDRAGRDAARFHVLRHLLLSRPGRQAVIFTHSAETAEAAFVALRGTVRVALLTGRGAALASGPISRREILSQFAPVSDGVAHGSQRHGTNASRIDVLVASDVASEGIDLQRAGIIVHLDLPWTVARLEQRMGRVRRIGSRHASVEAHLIAPPVDAHELDTTLRHLERKAGIAAATLGGSSVLGDAGEWGALLPATGDTAPAIARNDIRRLVRRLEALAARAAGRAGRLRAGPSAPAPPTTAAVVRWPVCQRVPPCVVALVSIDGSAHVVVATSHEVSHDPVVVRAVIEALLEDIAAARPDHPDQPDHPDHPDRPEERERPARTRRFVCDRTPSGDHAAALDAVTASDLEGRVRDWCRAHTAIGQVVPSPARNSPSHRRLLHALDALVSRTPRARRSRMASAVGEAHTLVLRQQGVGAERLLDSLAATCPPAGTGSDEEQRWIDQVVRALRAAPVADVGAIQADGHHAGAVLEGMLTLIRAHRPA